MKQVLLFACALALPISSFASEGSSVRGGANNLVAEFMGVAESLLTENMFRPQEREAIERALRKAKIVAVPVLMDPDTGKPIPHQEKLVAWGAENLVQLKSETKNPNDESFAKFVEQGRPIAHIVIHELFRASGWANAEGRSPDDQFELTIGRYRLNERFDATVSMWLHAQCEVKSCKHSAGLNGAEDVTCAVGESAFVSSGWSKATVRLYKYQGKNPTQNSRGFLGINYDGFPLTEQIGFSVLDNVKLLEDAEGIRVESVNRDRKFQNFLIPHSRQLGAVTRGHAEIGFGRIPGPQGKWVQRWVVLEMECQTMVPNMKGIPK